MITKSANVGWSAMNDSYHLQQVRKRFPERDYLNALAQAVQEAKPALCFRAAMREAIAIDDYTVGALAGQKLGCRTRAILEEHSVTCPAN